MYMNLEFLLERQHRSGCQLKAGFRTPDMTVDGALLPLRRVREKMKKQRLITPRMMMPEMSALVTVFIRKTGLFSWAIINNNNTKPQM